MCTIDEQFDYWAGTVCAAAAPPVAQLDLAPPRYGWLFWVSFARDERCVYQSKPNHPLFGTLAVLLAPAGCTKGMPFIRNDPSCRCGASLCRNASGLLTLQANAAVPLRRAQAGQAGQEIRTSRRSIYAEDGHLHVLMASSAVWPHQLRVQLQAAEQKPVCSRGVASQGVSFQKATPCEITAMQGVCPGRCRRSPNLTASGHHCPVLGNGHSPLARNSLNWSVGVTCP